MMEFITDCIFRTDHIFFGGKQDIKNPLPQEEVDIPASKHPEDELCSSCSTAILSLSPIRASLFSKRFVFCSPDCWRKWIETM